jgi:hypothetical protein
MSAWMHLIEKIKVAGSRKYRAFCYVQTYAPIQSVIVLIERLARRIDVPTTFDVDVTECIGIGIGCLARTKAPACCCCAVRTPFQTTPHLTSPVTPGSIQSLKKAQGQSNNRTRTTMATLLFSFGGLFQGTSIHLITQALTS